VTRLLGLDFDDLDARQAAAWIDTRAAGAPFGYVVTPNADHLVRLEDNAALAAVYRAALLRLMDSRVVARAAWLFGLPNPSVVTGSDMTEILLRRHLRPGERITVIGLRPEWLGPLVARLGLALPHHFDPPPGFWRQPDDLARTVDFVLTHPARLVFLAVGSPQQEWLAAAIAETGKARGTALCIGASLAFLAGADRRAPVWVRKAGLEWAFRLTREPRRLTRRYLLQSPRVFALLAAERWRRRSEKAA
jgi:N-acetylglucosaminyldiphosphoundecaprenol N-acetyl-beta-D-mannosaminyltransferase